MISIVIPAYNEARRIGPTLARIAEYMKSRGEVFELHVVDDGSTDGTGQVVLEAAAKNASVKLITYTPNMGKGFAVRKGILASAGDIVLISDADLSTPIEEIERLRPLIGSANGKHCSVAIGSRALPDSRVIVSQPLWRQSMGKIFNRIVRLLVLNGFSDTQCGFKLFEARAARRIFSMSRIDKFAYDVEILLLARTLGYGISEVPVKWINSPDSKVHPVADSLQMLKDLVRIRLTTNGQKGEIEK